jgi:hypothetical protein
MTFNPDLMKNHKDANNNKKMVPLEAPESNNNNTNFVKSNLTKIGTSDNKTSKIARPKSPKLTTHKKKSSKFSNHLLSHLMINLKNCSLRKENETSTLLLTMDIKIIIKL